MKYKTRGELLFRNYKDLDGVERRQYDKRKSRIELEFIKKMTTAITWKNRIKPEEMVDFLVSKNVLLIPLNKEEKKKSINVVKKVYKKLKSIDRMPYINTRGYVPMMRKGKIIGTRYGGHFGWCIPDDESWKPYDKFLKNLEKGIKDERVNAEERTADQREQQREAIERESKSVIERVTERIIGK